MRKLVLCLLVLTAFGCGNSSQTPPPPPPQTQPSPAKTPPNYFNDPRALKLKKLLKVIEPFFKPMGAPKPDEWLASFKEPGQTFDEYLKANPILPTAERKTIYIQPIGTFSDTQQRVIKLTADYMREFFGLPVKLLAEKQFPEPLSTNDYRFHPQWKIKQIRTGYILDKLLKPNLPADAAVMIAFTSEDLYPAASMNYVFGQGSLENRVGVWSLHRLEDKKDFKRFLSHAFKIATHETGHMFSMLHCTKYECEMSGTNHIVETDKHPLDACPECMAKICWLADYPPQKRYENLAGFCQSQGLLKEAEDFRAKAKAIEKATANLTVRN